MGSQVSTAIILNGNGWQRAEDEAEAIIRKAFNRLGRGVERRPTNDQARDEYFIPVENCLVCYRPLDDQSIAMRLRYCSPNHAKFAYEKRAYAEGAYNSEYGQAAYKMLYRERFKDQTCANPKCKHPIFKPYSEDQRFCTPACLYESQVIDYPERECALEDCSHWFKPKHKQKEGTSAGMFCSRECADKARSARAYDLECQLCGDPFEAAMPNAVACCNGHYQILRKFEKGTPPKRVSPPVFDYMFRPVKSPIMALFDAA